MSDVAAPPASGADTSATPAALTSEILVRMRLDALRTAPWQPRGDRTESTRAGEPSDEAVDAGAEVPDLEHHALLTLARAIHDAGDLLEPVVVRPAPDEPGVYQMIAGHRRTAAVRLLAEGRVSDAADLDARDAPRRRTSDTRDQAAARTVILALPAALRGPDGAPVVPARVRDVDDVQARRDTFSENAHRADLSAWDRAHAVAAFRDALASESGRTGAPEQREVAHALRMTRSIVSECLSIVAGLSPEVIDDAVRTWGWTRISDDARYALRRIAHAALCRAARAGSPGERATALRDALDRVRRRSAPTRDGGERGAETSLPPIVHTARSRYERLREGAPFDFRRTRGLAACDPADAAGSLAELAPAVGLLAARAAGGAPVALDIGDGGTVLVLPGDPGDLDAPRLAETLAAVLDIHDRLQSARALRHNLLEEDARSPSVAFVDPDGRAVPPGQEETQAARARREAAADTGDTPAGRVRSMPPASDAPSPSQLGLAL